MSTIINPQEYVHSPIHYAVATFNHVTLTKLLSNLPKPPDPTQINQYNYNNNDISQVFAQISATLDRRDNPLKETPLHLAVRLNSVTAATALATAGADISLQNAAGWNPLQEAILRRRPEIVAPLVRHHHTGAWAKWVRRRPVIASALRQMRDFYMEISFHFESSIVPFVGKIAPSDTYRIWKRDGNLRADTSLAGYDGLKVQRVNQTFLFLNDVSDNDENEFVREGCLLILNHDEKRIYDAFETAGNPLSDSDIAIFCNQTSVFRPGVDVTKAELVSRTNWRKQEKYENVGAWKARVYDMHNVTFSFRSRKLNGVENREDPFSPTCVLPLEIDEESDEAFIVAENPRFSVSDRGRRHSSFVREDREFVTVSRKSVDIFPAARMTTREVVAPVTKEKEFAKGLRPVVWLSEQFPLKTDELLPLLDILADKVKAVRRVREVLTTKFPVGTFPVKVAIPVVPTVRVVITFTKFEELPPVENFYTPVTSPRQLASRRGNEDENARGESSGYFSLSSSWLRGGGSNQKQSGGSGSGKGQVEDPFRIPSDYVWSSFDEKNSKGKKSRSAKRTK